MCPFVQEREREREKGGVGGGGGRERERENVCIVHEMYMFPCGTYEKVCVCV